MIYTKDNLKAGMRVAWEMADDCVMTGTITHVGYSSSTVERVDGGTVSVKHSMMHMPSDTDVFDALAFFQNPSVLYLWYESPDDEPQLKQVGTLDSLLQWLQRNQSFSWDMAFSHSWWSLRDNRGLLRDHTNVSRVLSGRNRHLYRQ